MRFLCVGASGYGVNLVSFFILVHPFSASDTLAFVLAAVIASTNNFFWNRHWTFRAKQDHPGRQALRFFFVSFLVLLFSRHLQAARPHRGSHSTPWPTASPGSSRLRSPSSSRSSGASRPEPRSRPPARRPATCVRRCAPCSAWWSRGPAGRRARPVTHQGNRRRSRRRRASHLWPDHPGACWRR